MKNNINIWVPSDHAGYDLKRLITSSLKENVLANVFDVGPYDEKRVDYPVYGWKVAEKVSKSLEIGEKSFGILVCGTGIGMSVVANKCPGIRAALAHNVFTAEMARRHNNANVLCIGARVTGQDISLNMVDVFLKSEFEGGRHQSRLKIIESYL